MGNTCSSPREKNFEVLNSDGINITDILPSNRFIKEFIIDTLDTEIINPPSCENPKEKPKATVCVSSLYQHSLLNNRWGLVAARKIKPFELITDDPTLIGKPTDNLFNINRLISSLTSQQFERELLNCFTTYYDRDRALLNINSRLVRYKGKLYLQAIKPINVGDEIFRIFTHSTWVIIARQYAKEATLAGYVNFLRRIEPLMKEEKNYELIQNNIKQWNEFFHRITRYPNPGIPSSSEYDEWYQKQEKILSVELNVSGNFELFTTSQHLNDQIENAV